MFKMFLFLVSFLLTVNTYSQTTNFYPKQSNIDTSARLTFDDFTYLGAFRPPQGRGGATEGFSYLGNGMTYSPNADTLSNTDNFPGAITMVGHGRYSLVGQFNIPTPVNSKVLSQLPYASWLKSFVQFGVMPVNPGERVLDVEEIGDSTYVTMGDGYLPSQNPEPQRSFSFGPKDLSSYAPMKTIGPDIEDCYNDYILETPKWWSEKYFKGTRMLTGRHRGGDLCGRGPALFAVHDSSLKNDHINTTPVMRFFTRSQNDSSGWLPHYSHGGDLWTDAQFIESGHKSTILFTGVKGLSGGIYGNFCRVQGFHDTAGYRPYFLFFDPDTIGRNATIGGSLHLNRPYQGVDVNEYVMVPNMQNDSAGKCTKRYFNNLAYDKTNKILYASEDYQNTPVIHAWKIKEYENISDSTITPDTLIVPDTVVVVDSTVLPDTTSPPDTTVSDSTVVSDTVVVVDTLIVPDTVIVTDTVVVVDTPVTVINIVPHERTELNGLGYVHKILTSKGFYLLLDIRGVPITIIKEEP